jgi:hypothetical protein
MIVHEISFFCKSIRLRASVAIHSLKLFGLIPYIMQNFRNGVWLALVLDFYCYSCLLLLANGHPFTIAALWLLASYLLFLSSFFRYIFLNIFIHISASKGLFH